MLGIIVIPIELYISSIWISKSSYAFTADLIDLTYMSNLCFYAGIMHMIFSLILSGPTLLTWFDKRKSKKHQDHFERLGQPFNSQFGAQTQYGYDEVKSERNSRQGFSFFVPGGILLIVSIVIGL